MSQLDLSYYSKKDLPNILVYIELILTVFLPSFRLKDYMTNYRNFDRGKYFNIHTSKDSDPDVRKFLADYGVGIGRSFMVPYLVMAAIYIVLVLVISILVKLMERSLKKSDRRH